MTIKYMKFEVSIHGLDAPDLDAAAGFMAWWLKGQAFILLNDNEFGSMFNPRNEFDSDIEVELVESAGQDEMSGT